MTRLARHLLAALPFLFAAATAPAEEAGWRQIQLPATAAGAVATTVALYYPTLSPARTVPMGAFTLQVAPGSPPVETVKGLILLSHGIGGSELGHSSLAQALARHGYLVAAMRHPGDNWQDRSLIEHSAARYFDERPRQASRVIDALLADPFWKERIARDSQGPRVGALGHSAGGYTVLALAGALPEVAQIATHCQGAAAQDPVFCGIGRSRPAGPAAEPPPGSPQPAPPASSSGAAGGAPLRDPRVRAVVAMAPAGVMLTAGSLARVAIPVRIYGAGLDGFLAPAFHAEWVSRHLPAGALQRVANAGHFAFMDTPNMPLPSPGGDIGADPPGFDRAAFLTQLGTELAAYFDSTLR